MYFHNNLFQVVFFFKITYQFGCKCLCLLPPCIYLELKVSLLHNNHIQ